MYNKIGLGTVQFGLDYGVNNKTGKISSKEAGKILKYALTSGIDTIDTAYNYGDSEEVIGNFILRNKADFNIISKVPSSNPKEVDLYLNQTLSKLKQDWLYGYLIHDFNSFLQNKEILSEIQKYKDKKIKKIGFSLYYPSELEYLFNNNISFDIVQIPFNIFDQRFNKLLPILKKRNVEIHTRSVFLQGLVFKQISELEGIFVKLEDKLTALCLLSVQSDITVSSLCLNFALLNPYIDKVIIGVDSLNNLKENIKNVENHNKVKKIYSKLSLFSESNEDIILPTNWK